MGEDGRGGTRVLQYLPGAHGAPGRDPGPQIPPRHDTAGRARLHRCLCHRGGVQGDCDGLILGAQLLLAEWVELARHDCRGHRLCGLYPRRPAGSRGPPPLQGLAPAACAAACARHACARADHHECVAANVPRLRRASLRAHRVGDLWARTLLRLAPPPVPLQGDVPRSGLSPRHVGLCAPRMRARRRLDGQLDLDGGQLPPVLLV